MGKLLEKFVCLSKKLPVVVITGEGRKVAKETIFQVLKNDFKIGREIFIFETEDDKIKEFEFFLKKSELPILVVTHVGEIPFDRDYFAGEIEKVKFTRELAKILPPKSWLVLNYDDETVREIDDITNLKTFTFGFSERANFWVSNIKLNRGTNFKVNYKGSVVPFWLEGIFGKEQIYGALAAVAVGIIFGKNLVEISQALREYKTQPGKMRLLEGIKGSFILDDAESATVSSMIEAIEILGDLSGFKRKIAVLGDIVGVGEYTIAAHLTIGEKVVQKKIDLLFTFGPRAKFIAKGAMEKGMSSFQIFSFDKIEDGIEKLKEIVRAGDLILIDGSKEMKMSEIVDKLRKIW